MPDIYIQDSPISNTIFLFYVGLAVTYGVCYGIYWLFTRRK